MSSGPSGSGTSDRKAEPPATGDQISSIGRHGVIYGAGMILNRIAGFLLIPVLLHTLSAQQWGIYSLILAVSQFLLVVPAAMVDAMVRLHFDQEDQRSQTDVTASTLAAFSIVSAIVLVLSYPAAVLSAHIVFGGPYNIAPLVVANVGLVFELLLEIELAYLRIHKRSGFYVSVSLLRSLTQFGTAILFVVGFGMGVMGVVLGGAVSAALVTIPIGIVIARRSGLRLVPRIAKEMRRLTSAMAPAWLAKAGLDLLEPFLVSALSGLAAVGILAVANKLADQLRLLITGPFSRIWEVTLFEAGSNEQQAEAVHRALAYFLLLLGAAGLGLALYAPEIVRVIAAHSFWSAAAIVPILVLNPISRLVNFHFEIALIERKQTIHLPTINILTLALALGLYYLLVPRLGLMGAALAGLTTQIGRLGLTLAFVARCSDYVSRFPWRAAASLLMVGLACWGAGRLLFPDIGIGDAAGKLLLVIAFVVLGVLGPTFRPSERRSLLNAVRRWSLSRTASLGWGGAQK